MVDGSNQVVAEDNTTQIISKNAIRYRGYYYDEETKFYYLQSRYYNPDVGRFLNSDNITDPGSGILGYNTFIYCANNPVNGSDPTGHGVISDWFKKGIEKIESYIDTTIGRAIAYCSDVKNNTELYGKLDNLTALKNVVDFAVKCSDLQRDIDTHAHNVVGYAKDPNYQIQELSSNICIDYNEYQRLCKASASNLTQFAPQSEYQKKVQAFKEDDINLYAKNISSEDRAFFGVLNDSYGDVFIGFAFDFCMP